MRLEKRKKKKKTPKMNEQELILTSVLNCKRVDLYTKKVSLSENQKKEIENIKKRRFHGEPIQYILGVSNFMGLDFLVDSNVLIPRPETEILVETVLRHVNTLPLKNLQILDIGTGSGNVAVSLAKNMKEGVFTAIDISLKALDIAKKNAHKHGVDNQIKFDCLNILEDQEFLGCNKEFDIIVSNPPYVKSKDILGLSQEVQKEPGLALDGGDDGFIFYRAIANKANYLLKDKGFVFLEIGQGQEKEIESIFRETTHFGLKDCLNDYSNIKRIMILEKRNV